MQLNQYMTYTFQQKLINACQYIQKYFNHISKTIEVIMKLHVKMYLSPT